MKYLLMCDECGATDFKSHIDRDEFVCLECGTIIDEDTAVSLISITDIMLS